MQNVTVDDNYHTRLDLRLGAPLEDVEEAFVRLDSEGPRCRERRAVG